MKLGSIVTLDIGGTTINTGLFREGVIEEHQIRDFAAHESAEAVLSFILSCIKCAKQADTIAIAIGVPCIVDIEHGVVFDAVNIPAWQKYDLKAALSEHFSCEIYINNDVNCFVAGEYRYGAGAQFKDVVGICLGTGFGSGFVLNHQLHAGHNCCAGEVGGIPYLNGTIDDYCSGQFFKDNYHATGAELAVKASSGDVEALKAFEAFGKHLAKAISYLLFMIDPQIITIGGSVSQSYAFFIEALQKELNNFPYKIVTQNLTITKSELENAALLGAAHLYLDTQK